MEGWSPSNGSGKIIIADNLIHNTIFFTNKKSICLELVNKVYGKSNSRNCPYHEFSDEPDKKESSNSLFQIKKLKI